MRKKRVLIPMFVPVFVASLIVVMQLSGCDNTSLEADSDQKYLDLNEIGVTVLIGPEKAIILLDISQEFQDPISIINYSMDEHDLVLKSPTQTRSIYVMAQLQIENSETVHLQDRIRLVIHCNKPI